MKYIYEKGAYNSFQMIKYFRLRDMDKKKKKKKVYFLLKRRKVKNVYVQQQHPAESNDRDDTMPTRCKFILYNIGEYY